MNNRYGLYRTRIGRYFPRYYEGILETDELIKVENDIWNNLYLLLNKAKNNQFIAYADEDGIYAYEQLFQIVADPETETLEERRFRLLNRIQTLSYYTMIYLRQKLNSLFGENNYEVEMDYLNYTLYVKSNASNSFIYKESIATINKIKPANIVFINVPFIPTTIEVGEEIYQQKWWWNYILGGKWRVGQKPFISVQDLSKLKSEEVQSLTPLMLNKLKTFTGEEIKAVLINDTYKITTFVQKIITGGYLRIQYNVKNWEQIQLITNIKFLDENDLILSNDPVYIPISSDTMIEHRINIREVGTND
nr:MAG TPA: tail protein [Caudoviricetes sp.]